MNTTFEKNDLVEYVEQYVDLKDLGKYLQGKCPFHDDHTPSFVVYPNDNPDNAHWRCFTCNIGGDIIDFCMRYHKLAFYEAKAIVCQELTPAESFARKVKAKYTYRPYDKLLLSKRIFEKFGSEPLSVSLDRSFNIDRALENKAFNEIEALLDD